MEDLQQLERTGVALAPRECRRNIVTSGVRLQPLIGKRFRIGEVECSGIGLCPPCNHLEELTRPGPLRGLRAHIRTSGQIAVGDIVGTE